jgi:hypothetical protein
LQRSSAPAPPPSFADQLQRHCVGIELNPEYAEMAETRIAQQSPLFCQVSCDKENQQLSAND